MNAHAKIHDKSNPNKCNVCQKVFLNNYNLILHKRTCTGKKTFVCNTCSRGFAKKGNLKRHQATHSDEKPYECQVCTNKKCFKTKDQLSKHMKYHKEPTYHCEKCGKTFHFKSHLKSHQSTHSDGRPYKCQICVDNIYFKTKYQLSYHMESHKESTHQCEKCGKKFHKKIDFKRHQSTHSDEKPYKCQICPDKRCFKTKHQFSKHMKCHKESTNKCGKTFPFKSQLKSLQATHIDD